MKPSFRRSAGWSYIALLLAIVSLGLPVSPYVLEYEFTLAVFCAVVCVLLLKLAANASSLRGIVAVLFVLWLTVVIPLLLYVVDFLQFSIGWLPRSVRSALGFLTFVWPQLVFFGPTLSRVGGSGGHFLPYMWAGAITLLFWVVIATSFGFVTRRVRRPMVLLSTAFMAVFAPAVAVRAVAPLVGWKMSVELP